MSSVLGRRFGKVTKIGWLGIVALLSITGASRAEATETEVRDFEISLDGKVWGNYRMTISRHDDGKMSVTGQANVVVKKAFITVYRYSYSGTEWWQDGKEGRLLRLDSTSNEDGKQFDVHAAASPNGLRVVVNGQERPMSADAWTTTYWRLAAARFHNNAVPLLDADTGRGFNGRLEFVGTEQLPVGGQNRRCHHFRVTGGPNGVDDLWYDDFGRLVRQEFTERNTRTVLTLVRVSR
jgi:hypothetical protein